MRRFLYLAVVFLLAVTTLGAKDVPYLGGRVNDTAGMLDQATRQKLEEKLEALEKDTGAQVAVLTVDSLEGEALEDYALKVASTWKLGQKGQDNGLLMLIAKQERRIRIEVGYGLEGTIPDARAKQIIDGIMTPAFKRGDFSAGVDQAVDAVSGLIRGEAVEIPEGGPTLGEALSARLMTGLIFFVVIGIFSIQAVFGKGGGAWFLYFFLMPFYGTFPMAIFGPWGLALLILWIAGFPVLRIMTWHSGWGRNFRTTHAGLIHFASTSGSSSGGGGFSGGGGSFGGGGASGGW